MAFLPKEVLHEEARKLGWDPADYGFAQLQGMVSKALAGTDSPVMESPNKDNSYELDKVTHKKVVGKAHVIGYKRPTDADVFGKEEKIIFSPEMRLHPNQRFGFEEIVGDEPKRMSDPFAEMRMKLGSNTDMHQGGANASSTPAILEKTGKKVVAQTGMPHGNAEIYYQQGSPAGLFSARFGNVDGYVWVSGSPITIVDPNDPQKFIHVNIRSVKEVLEELDRYADWADKCERYQRYAFNIKVIDKSFVHSMLRQIVSDIQKERALDESLSR